MAQSTTNLGKIHVFPSETLYNQFKDIIADNDLALLKDDGAYIVAALLEQNGYVKFSNGLILQWGMDTSNSLNENIRRDYTFPLSFNKVFIAGGLGFANQIAGGSFQGCGVYSWTNTTITITGADNGNCYAMWIAVGQAQQWGVTDERTTVTFPIAFRQSCYTVNCNGSGWNSSGSATSAGISIKSLTLESFVISTWETAPYRWVALGMQRSGELFI